MKPGIPRIEGERIALRPLQEDDLELTLRWRNQAHIRRWFIYSDVITPEQHRSWYQKYLARDDDLVFIIEERMPVSRPIGQVALYDIGLHGNAAEFGRLMIGDAADNGKGFAREATRLLVDYGLSALGLQRIYLEVFQNNAAALSVYTGCGFREVGRNGDLIEMSIER